VDLFVVASSNQNVEFVVLVVDPTQIEADLANNKKKKNVRDELSFPRLMGCKIALDRVSYGC
jgi:hypothetical protein